MQVPFIIEETTLYQCSRCLLKLGFQIAHPTGIYRWSIILADTDFFQQSVSAADFRGRNNRPSAKHLFIKLAL